MSHILNSQQNMNYDHMQYQLMNEQDEDIIEINQIAIHMKNHGKTINKQINKQNAMIEQLNDENIETISKLQQLQHKIGNLLETQDLGQVCTCQLMLAIACILLLLIILL